MSPGEIVATYSATCKVGFFSNLWHNGGFKIEIDDYAPWPFCLFYDHAVIQCNVFYDVSIKTLSSLLDLNLVILVDILKPCSVPHHFQAVLSLVDPLSTTCLHCVAQFILHQTRHNFAKES